MSAWWRANRWYLLVVAIALPVAVVVAMIPRWFPYLDRQPVYQEALMGETVRYAGADFTLGELTVLDGEEWNGPAGADVVVASLTVDVVDPLGGLCDAVIRSDEAGFEREWDSELFPDVDYEVPDDAERRCQLDEERAYDLVLMFLVPRGQVEEPVLQLTASKAAPLVLRLRLR
jgi:hypothetical protein